MEIPTEPIGSIPRPRPLIDALHEHDRRVTEDGPLETVYDEAIRDTLAKFEATGSPLITAGEQRKFHNFRAYCVEGLPNTALAERTLGMSS